MELSGSDSADREDDRNKPEQEAATLVQRCRSMDDLMDFSSDQPRMEEIVSQLDKICEDTRWRKRVLPWKAGGAALGAGAVAFFFAPVTGGLSLFVTGGGAVVGAAGNVVVHDKITDQRTLDEVKRLITEFCEMVQPLKDVQPEKTAMLKKLDRKVEATVMRLQSLVQGLYALFIDFNSDSTVQRLLEVTEQCRIILQELEELRRNI